MKNEKWLKDILSQLDYWQGRPMVKFHFNPLYQVGVAKDTNLDFIFGTKRKVNLKNLRKLKYFSIEAPFPKDSIIFFQPSRERIIVASREEGKVFKISSSKQQLSFREGEIKLLEHLGQSEFAPYTAKILEHHLNWSVTSFCSNRDSLLNIPKVDEYLLENMDTLVMGPMAKFYRSFELKTPLLSEWLSDVKKRAQDHPHRELIEKLILKINKFQDINLLQGQLHLDLHAGNILRDGNQVTIIDFEMTHLGLILIDYFDFYRRFLNKSKHEQKLFESFMRDGKVPPRLEQFYSKFQIWLAQFKVPAPPLKLVFFLYALERTLIYWEKGPADRLKDKKGFEYQIICSILK